MGAFFNLFKSKETKPETLPDRLTAPAQGSFVTMAEIPDPMFSEGILGTCIGVDPEIGEVRAPCDGTVTQLADTLHAVGLEVCGAEVLIHVGVDTVEMQGDGFSSKVKVGQKVHRGDLLLTMDLAKIAAAGHPTTVIMAVTNSDELASVEPCGSGTVSTEDAVLRLRK